jgi:hypothetical protein
MNIKPILFSTPMVQSILEGRKTMTRRVVKGKTDHFVRIEIENDGIYIPYVRGAGAKIWAEPYIKCPYGQVGDIIWLRETWQHTVNLGINILDENSGYIYKASENGKDWEENTEKWKWKPSLFMPKEACRLFLKITNVKVERLQDISEKDAKAEGVESCIADRENFGVRAAGMRLYRDYDRKNNSLKDYPCNGFEFAKTSFETLWQSINGEQSWNDNPYVWVLEFEQCEKPLNFLKQ